jgi:purine-nucleoside phosphorylase
VSATSGDAPVPYYDRVAEAVSAIRRRIRTVPEIAIVLGSGLGDFAVTLGEQVSIPYGDLPHWPQSAVVGHEGRLVIGTVKGRIVAALSGRSHLYEGHDLATVTFAVRVLGLLGVKTLILTNAAGGINLQFSTGGLMVIDDHINLLGGNPLVGANDERFGVRFPDMTEVYSPRLRAIAHEAGRANGLVLPHGVYAALLGPSYETPAEIRYLRAIGADAVGMSTVPEAIVARHMKVDVLGISCITNMAAGVLPQPLDHAEVMETARRVRGQFIALLEEIIDRI